MPTDDCIRLDDRQRIANFRKQPIEANEYHSVDGAEGEFLWSSSPKNVDLLPQRPNLCLKHYPRPDQIDNHPTNEPAKIPHCARSSSDSRSAAKRDKVCDRDSGQRPSRLENKNVLSEASARRANDREELSMDWFEKLTGFREAGYDDTRVKLKVEGDQLKSLVNGKSYRIGDLELVSLQALRERVASAGALPGRLKVSVVSGDVRHMHQSTENARALFQVASQFNLLEMIGPEVTPEQGVTRYQNDRTQGPACAIAAGAATIYRNYFAMVDGSYGQTAIRQLDGLADLGEFFCVALNRPVASLWRMQNGYALCSRAGLDAIAAYLVALQPEQIDMLQVCIGVHRDVEVTDAEGEHRPLVSQAFCSALPVAYTGVSSSHWRPFASLVLEAAYEATMLAAVLNKQRGISNVVLLTLLGGGAFGNEEDWIIAAVRRALKMMSDFELDVRLVSYREPVPAIQRLVKDFG